MLVACGAVGVAMNHVCHTGRCHRGVDCGRIDVGPARRFALVLILRTSTQAPGFGLAYEARQVQPDPLYERGVYDFAETLVLRVIRAIDVAVREQDFFVFDLDPAGVGQDGQTAGLGETLGAEEIPVAGNEIDADAVASQFADSAALAGKERVFKLVVANPIFEQIAEYVECQSLAGGAGKKGCKGLFRSRIGRRKVQVGDKVDGVQGRKRAAGAALYQIRELRP